MNLWRELHSFFRVVGFETCFAHLSKAFDKVIDDWLFREGTPADYFVRPLFLCSRREIKVMSETFDRINVDRLRWDCRERWDCRRMDLWRADYGQASTMKWLASFMWKKSSISPKKGREGFSQKKNSRQKKITEWLSFNQYSWKRNELDKSR